jgi:2-polyprenyl-3-methyl-5-hydroxy-6-metoxy-1,4-benzoquinol methylase
MRQVEQFDSISGKYSAFVGLDPVRQFLHYPAIIQLLGDIRGKSVLDIGCGDGVFDRVLAKDCGAKVVGYDKATDLIAIAQKSEQENPLDVEYVVSDPVTFKSDVHFDESFSVMVLSYAPDVDYLLRFFKSAYDHLKSGGRFMSVIFNPEFKAFNTVLANRLFKQKAEEVEVNFLNPGTKEVQFTALLKQFTTEEYEAAAKKAGFRKVSWGQLFSTNQGKQTLGNDFWTLCEKEQPYAVVLAEK